MTTVSMQCPDCNAPMTANVGESYIDGRLRWYQSYRCSECGNATELDDFGFPPNNIRGALIDELGCWKVVLEETNEKSKAAQLIRKELGLSIVDAKKLLGTFPQMYVGTEVECIWLKHALEQYDVVAVVIPCANESADVTKGEL